MPEARAHVLDGSMLGGSLFWDASLDLKPSLGFGGERSAMLIGTKVTSKGANLLMTLMQSLRPPEFLCMKRIHLPFIDMKLATVQGCNQNLFLDSVGLS